jgi:hypothetical protein
MCPHVDEKVRNIDYFTDPGAVSSLRLKRYGCT